MPIRLLLEHDHSLAPDEVAKLVKAFEGALTQLGLANRKDPATTLVAKAIIEAAKGGEHDPKRLRDAVMQPRQTNKPPNRAVAATLEGAMVMWCSGFGFGSMFGALGAHGLRYDRQERNDVMV